ncbi:hypothetical protein CPB84DRAFT_1776901 [Gymnopilus junonius]|uniref:Uncharacterized protein n=1 Tax=Gymnopilus junonius TaxID=109634 RepID=A0A9P5NRW0_GYMJU|nr:hypothetical protein CPB84DRAFT_1776901 [Gymnopilus junonius]
MQPTPSPHSFPLSLWPSSRFGAYCTTIGLSAAAIYGTVRVVKLWGDVQRAHLAALEKGRRQEEELVSLRQLLKERDAEIGQRKAADIDRLRKHVIDLEKDREGARKQNQALVDQTRNLGSRNQQLESELRRAKVEHAQLKGAQAFLTKADQLSGADVIQIELAIEQKKVDGEEEEEQKAEAYARTEDIIGSRMTNLLKTSEHHEDPILVQIALQASMSAYSHWIVSSWAFESPDDEHMLSEIYARVRETEEQAVSGRWRQLTRSHLQRMLVQEPDLTTDMVDACAKIFVVAGLKGIPSAVHERIMDKFGKTISRLMTQAQQLNKKIGEGVTSCDLEALYIAPDVAYNVSMMEDALGTPAGKEEKDMHEKILCTTDLGLVRAEKISGRIGEWQESVLLKPKVMLHSGILGSNGNAE